MFKLDQAAVESFFDLAFEVDVIHDGLKSVRRPDHGGEYRLFLANEDAVGKNRQLGELKAVLFA